MIHNCAQWIDQRVKRYNFVLFALWRPGSPTREKPISVDGLNSVKISGTFLDILYPAGFE